MHFLKELSDTDFDDLFGRLVGYATRKLRSVDIRTLDGMEPCDLVADIVEKALKNIRNPDNADCSLKEFLFGCVRSDIDAFFNRKKMRLVDLNDEIEIILPAKETISQTIIRKEKYVTYLQEVGADKEEIDVFNIWAEGITKPAEVGRELALSSTEIYKIQRRLLKHLEIIRKKSKVAV
jgi:DNA-directed RNA polymerase specialized sigma24 family protein